MATTKMIPRARRKAADRRFEIISAAKKRFAIGGFDGTSTRQIADDLGVAQSLLLYHFKTKDDLWKAVMAQIFEHINDIVRDEIAQSGATDAKTQLIAGIRSFIRICQEEPDLHCLMTMEGRSRTPRLEWLVDHYIRNSYSAMILLIEECQRQGEVRSGDPTLLYYSIIAIAGSAFTFAPEMGMLNPHSIPVDPETVEKLIRGTVFVTT